MIKAKKEGLIPEVKPMMEALIQDGLYVDETIQKMVLEASGENK